MANKRMYLSGTGKEILDLLSEALEIERPQAIQIALAKGIKKAHINIQDQFKDDKDKWTIPDNIIKDREYLLFKHLIINEVNASLSEDQVNQYLLLYIEHGLRNIKEEMVNLSSLEDYRIVILVSV